MMKVSKKKCKLVRIYNPQAVDRAAEKYNGEGIAV